MTALSCRALSVGINGQTILSGIEFGVEPGQVLGLLGPNGAGKTTLLKALAGLIRADGEIALADIGLTSLSARDRARHIAFLPQGAIAHWGMPVRSVVALGRLPHQRAGAPCTVQDEAAIARAMHDVDIAELKDRPITSLSGGERARALLARALAVEAPVLLADEPVAYLDPRHQLGVMEVFANRAKSGTACVVVLHDLALAARYCHRVAVLDRGRLAAIGRPQEVMDAALLQSVFGIRAIDGRPLALPWEIAAP